jgi:hypothetical protein
MLLDFDAARIVSGKITSDFYCGASLVTTAGQKGSLEQKSCGAVEFDSARPFFWDIPVPIAPIVGTSRVTGCNFNACKVSAPTPKPTSQPSMAPKPTSQPSMAPPPTEKPATTKPTSQPVMVPLPTEKPTTTKPTIQTVKPVNQQVPSPKPVGRNKRMMSMTMNK